MVEFLEKLRAIVKRIGAATERAEEIIQEPLHEVTYDGDERAEKRSDQAAQQIERE